MNTPFIFFMQVECPDIEESETLLEATPEEKNAKDAIEQEGTVEEPDQTGDQSGDAVATDPLIGGSEVEKQTSRQDDALNESVSQEVIAMPPMCVYLMPGCRRNLSHLNRSWQISRSLA